MTIKTKKRIGFALCFINTIFLISLFAVILFIINKLSLTGIYGYITIVILTEVAVLLSSLTNRTKLLFTLLVVFLPYFGVCLCFYVWLSKGVNENSKFKKVGLYAQKQPILTNPDEEVTYFSQGKEMFFDLLKELENANEEILISTYIFKMGECVFNLLPVLFKALKRGVKVTLFADFYGSGNILNEEAIKTLVKMGANVRVLNKPTLLLLPKDNKRSHAKVFFVDRRIVYLGSLNIDDDCLYPDKNCGVKIKGQVSYFFNAYCSLWGLSPIKEVNSTRFCPFLSDNKYNVEKTFISMINSATKSILVMTPYLSLSDNMISAISYAVIRNVKITVLIPTDKKPSRRDKITCFFAKLLANNMVEVKEYNGGFLHSKMIIIDDNLCLIGSCNFDMRSGRYATESLLLSYDNRLIAPLLQDFNQTKKLSVPIEQKRQKGYMILTKLFKLFAPLV